MLGIFKPKPFTDEQLAEQCRQGKRSAQQALYDRYAGTMKAVCLRYVGQEFDAEDVLVSGFMKAFDKMGQYGGQGSLEGWLRRIMVNEALMFLRKAKRLPQAVEEAALEIEAPVVEADAAHDAEALMAMVQALPDGYRTVFNLYAIEGYSHAEIAERLGISEGTSKSQLSKARQLLKKAWSNA
jgi:RNA polymerase sigma-70 factor (ECF subfamily)